jgi:hypothetical protein
LTSSASSAAPAVAQISSLTGSIAAPTAQKARKKAKKRKATKRKATKKRKSRKLKFGSKAYRKKYLKRRRR